MMEPQTILDLTGDTRTNIQPDRTQAERHDCRQNHQRLYGVGFGCQEKDQQFYNQDDVARVPVYGTATCSVPGQ